MDDATMAKAPYSTGKVATGKSPIGKPGVIGNPSGGIGKVAKTPKPSSGYGTKNPKAGANYGGKNRAASKGKGK
jgi:hypothetical protein